MLNYLDRNISDNPTKRKFVKFAYVPKKFDASSQFFWIGDVRKPVLCIVQDFYFYFWEFDCSLASIRAIIKLELTFQSKVSAFENPKEAQSLYFMNEKDGYIKLIDIEVSFIVSTILSLTF